MWKSSNMERREYSLMVFEVAGAAMASLVGEAVSAPSPWSLLCVLAALLILWAASRAVEWYWLRPRRLGRALRAHGLSGTAYRFPAGDSAENVRLSQEAQSKPMSPPRCHDIVSRVVPHLHHTMREHGKVCFTWLGPIPRVVVARPELVSQILSNNSGHLERFLNNSLGELLSRGVGSLDGEKWAARRRILNPAFHLEKLKGMLPAFSTCCAELIGRWESKLAGGAREHDVWQEFPILAGDVISRTAFGSSFGEGRRIFLLQVEQAERVMKAFQYMHIPGYLFFPTENTRRMKAIKREVEGLLRGVIEKRERAVEEDGHSGNDLLGLMLQSNRASESSQDEHRGHDRGVLLTWTLVVLGMHPEWQDRAREEVVGVFGRDGTPSFDGLSRLKTVMMILNEVLRLYPPAVTMNRQTSRETQLGGVTYPAWVVFETPIILLHHSPEVWGEDVLEFRPERFADGISKATKEGQPAAFFPFGCGPRICIGQNFTLLEAKMALSMILQRFQWQLSPSYAHAPCTVLMLQPQHGGQIILNSL